MKASVPAPCPQVPGPLPVPLLVDSVLRAPLPLLPASVPLALLQQPPADSVLPALALPLLRPVASSVVPVAWA